MKVYLKEGQKVVDVDGNVYLIEKGDTLKSKSLQEADYRKLFDKYVLSKTEFKDAYKKQKDLVLSLDQIKALKNLINENDVLYLDNKTSAFDDDFSYEQYGREIIVLREPYGFFYVNNEGYDYARYVMYIPEKYTDELDL